MPAAAAVPPLSIANGTSILVELVVNGAVLETVPAGRTDDPIAARLPARPWVIEARSPSGRVLATLTVGATDAITSQGGRAIRADLACGRLEIWSGPPLLGGTFVADPARTCD
jgi:hypothetical protein